MRFAPWILATALASSVAVAQQTGNSFTGPCVGVEDGDTISVMRDGRAVKIRLEGIDAPEGGQDFSARSKQFLSDLVFQEQVTVIDQGLDKYGRLLGRVWARGLDINLEMVRAGYAWHYVYYSTEAALAEAQNAARSHGRGLWSQKGAVPPWEYRHRSDQRNVPSGATQAAPQAFTQTAEAVGYHGNVKSKVFHRSTCEHFNCQNCRASFSTREDAIAAGYRPCGVCRP